VIILRRMVWERRVARVGRREMQTGFLVEKPEGKRPHGRPRRRWEDINMDLKYGGRGWTGFIWFSVGTICRPF
jgi:hypothetical protein